MYKYISYISEQTHNLSEVDIQNLLKQSRNNNSTRGITGLLIFFEGVFTQFLEGPEAEIDAVYDAIRKDSRHKRLIELFSGRSETRFYGDWTMAYKTTDEISLGDLTGYRPFERERFFESPINNEHPGIQLLESFVNGLHMAS